MWSRRVLFAMLLVLAVLLVPIVVGGFLPKGHVASGSAVYGQPSERVWEVVHDFRRWPEWNSAVHEMERGPDRAGRPVWIARGEWGEMPSVIDVANPPRLLVMRIAEDAEVGLSGSWTYEIAEAPGGTSLTITERGEVDNPVFRFVSLFLDESSTLNRFLIDLGDHLAQSE